MNQNIFGASETKILMLLKTLDDANKYFPTILVPKPPFKTKHYLFQISHRDLLDYYDVNFWSTYTLLFRIVYEERVAKLSEFAFRALIEMGIEECFILYDSSVDSNDKKKYLLIKILVDYSSIETDQQPLFNDWFNRLIKEETDFIEQQFTCNQKGVLQDLSKNVQKFRVAEFTKALIATRRLSMQIKESIINNHKKTGDLKLSNEYLRMKSGESHTIHGNIFLISHRLEQQSREIHLFRLYNYLFLSGIEALKRVMFFLKSEEFTKEVMEVLSDLEVFKVTLIKEWENYQKIPPHPHFF